MATQKSLPDLNRSCTYHRDSTTEQVAYNLAWRDGMPECYPETFVRIASYPMGFKPSWACCAELYIMHIYEVPPIVEKP